MIHRELMRMTMMRVVVFIDAIFGAVDSGVRGLLLIVAHDVVMITVSLLMQSLYCGYSMQSYLKLSMPMQRGLYGRGWRLERGEVNPDMCHGHGAWRGGVVLWWVEFLVPAKSEARAGT